MSYFKTLALNIFCFGSGYRRLGRTRRWGLLVALFLAAALFLIVGFPFETFFHAPYLMFAACLVLPALDLLILKALKRLPPPPAGGLPGIALSFAAQWALVGALVWLAAHNLMTTGVIVQTSPNMLPQLKQNVVVTTRQWAWRPKVIGEPGLRRGDVVAYMTDDSGLAVRRIIALPGETLTLTGGVAAINGTPFAEEPTGEFDYPTPGGKTLTGTLRTEHMPDGPSYSIITKERERTPEDTENAAYPIPDGHLGVLSDNRPVNLTAEIRPAMVIPAGAVIARPVNILPEGNPLAKPKLVH